MPYYGTEHNPACLPRRWEPGQLQRGDLVFYHGERFWVESAPLDWSGTFAILIGDAFVPPGKDTGRNQPDKRIAMFVHADLLDPAPQVRHAQAKLPTVASVERTERIRAGEPDVGDAVALRLRGCTTLDAAYISCASLLGCPVATLKERYQHLNPGQQRMLIGNRMRGHVKKHPDCI